MKVEEELRKALSWSELKRVEAETKPMSVKKMKWKCREQKRKWWASNYGK